LLDKINDPRFEPEIAKILSEISRRREQFGKLLTAVGSDQRSTPDFLVTHAFELRAVIEVVLRLMFPEEVADLREAVDVLWDAYVDIQEALSQDPKHQSILAAIVQDAGQLDRRKLELLVRAVLDYVELRLAAVQRTEAEVVVIAHSMGAIIVNEILRRSEWFQTPRFKDIVYMGAACSIRDYEDSVFPYLKAHKHYLTQFHNLMLHPRAEDEEISLCDFVPRGSLLVYVDDYLTSPSTAYDRTLGQFANIMLALDRTQPEVADQIHMKVFSVGGAKQGPQQPEGHGEFTPARFWEPSFFRTKRQLRQLEKTKQGK
jgi:hypothetical protein